MPTSSFVLLSVSERRAFVRAEALFASFHQPRGLLFGSYHFGFSLVKDFIKSRVLKLNTKSAMQQIVKDALRTLRLGFPKELIHESEKSVIARKNFFLSTTADRGGFVDSDFIAFRRLPYSELFINSEFISERRPPALPSV